MRLRLERQRIKGAGLAALAVAALPYAGIGSAAQTPADGPTYTADGKLEFPAGYRTWVYLSTGMDMSYLERATPGQSTFGNVFVNREAYDGFLKNGIWPDKTALVLEVRKAEGSGAPLKSGHFQSEIVRTEVHVKDTARFRGGWGFFGFDDAAPAAVIPQSANCYSCHAENGAADTTFVQFYPTLLPVARAKNTLSPAYLADENKHLPTN